LKLTVTTEIGMEMKFRIINFTIFKNDTVYKFNLQQWLNGGFSDSSSFCYLIKPK